MAIQRVTIGLATTAALSWSFVIAIQMLAGAAVITSAPGRRTGMTHALELWFAGQLPYNSRRLAAAAPSPATSAGGGTAIPRWSNCCALAWAGLLGMLLLGARR